MEKQELLVKHSKEMLEKLKDYSAKTQERIKNEKEGIAREKQKTAQTLAEFRERSAQKIKSQSEEYEIAVSELRIARPVDHAVALALRANIASLARDEVALRTQFKSGFAEFLRDLRNDQQILRCQIQGYAEARARDTSEALKERIAGLQAEISRRCVANLVKTQRQNAIGISTVEVTEVVLPKPTYASTGTGKYEPPTVLAPSAFLTQWFIDNEAILRQ
jgi:hypothetical protein